MNYYFKRVAQAGITLILVITISFVMYRMMPGGPIQSLMQERVLQCIESQGSMAECDMGQIRRSVEQQVNIDPNKPVPVAYIDYLEKILLHQDFGDSTQYQEGVFSILFKAMPWSIFISLYGLALGWTFNVFWGAMLAYKEGKLFDKAGTIFAMIGNSIPYYVAAIIALSVLAYQHGFFPQGGRYHESLKLFYLGWDFGPLRIGWLINEPDVTPGVNVPFMVSAGWSAALPILTGFVLGISGLGMRGNAVRIMESDYIRVARLRGLSQSRIASRYLARNAILPLYTGFMIGIAGIFGSGIITERIFSYPAVGWYTFAALETRDYPLLMGAFIFYTSITLAGIVIAEFTYGLIDPRAGGGDSEAY